MLFILCFHQSDIKCISLSKKLHNNCHDYKRANFEAKCQKNGKLNHKSGKCTLDCSKISGLTYKEENGYCVGYCITGYSKSGNKCIYKKETAYKPARCSYRSCKKGFKLDNCMCKIIVESYDWKIKKESYACDLDTHELVEINKEYRCAERCMNKNGYELHSELISCRYCPINKK